MNNIGNELNEIDKKTNEALDALKKAAKKLKSSNSVINNIYSDGGGITIERLGQSIDNKDRELRHLRTIQKQMQKIIDVKTEQIQMMRDSLADNKILIDDLRSEIKLLKSKG